MRYRTKYNAVRTEVDDIKFASKAEAKYYEKLKATGKRFLRQVPFYLQGGVKYVVDFLEFDDSDPCPHCGAGEMRWVDVKGMETPTFKQKMRMMKEAYPWATIELVK